MTQHTHSEYAEGCYRCELSRDEVTWGCTENCPDDCMADHQGEK